MRVINTVFHFEFDVLRAKHTVQVEFQLHNVFVIVGNIFVIITESSLNIADY